MNILLITADDLNWNSVGVYGSKTPDVTPNIDRLAGEGIQFNHAHVTIAVCQPSRGALGGGCEVVMACDIRIAAELRGLTTLAVMYRPCRIVCKRQDFFVGFLANMTTRPPALTFPGI